MNAFTAKSLKGGSLMPTPLLGPIPGGKRVYAFAAGPLSLEELGAVITRYGVTTLWLTSGLFHLMVDERLSDLKGVRQLLAGGDVLSVPHVKRVVDELKDCQLINGYGPTENTTFTCCHPMTSTDDLGATVPIGRPLANTRLYVLDSALRPVPAGVPGELYIGGDGLARGYLGRPDLTDERFVGQPIEGVGMVRIYRTGDVARWLESGEIDLVGRIDHQVKIRGQRIEPGEIESVLSSHPSVREAVVVLHAPVDRGRRIARVA